MLTAKQVLVSRLPFVEDTTAHAAQADILIQSAFINCEQCFSIRWLLLLGAYVEDWTRVGVESNYNPQQIQLVAIMAAIAYLESMALENAKNIQQNIGGNAASRFISEVKAGSTDTKFEQPNQYNLPMIANIASLIAMFQKEANALSGQMGCYVSGSMVQAMFSEKIVNSSFYVHKDIC